MAKARTEIEIKLHLMAMRRVTESFCWEWTGSLNSGGYGKIKWRKYGDLIVHRLSAMLFLGFDIKDKRLVCHRCDNPKCFNPDHLFIGTFSDNMLDCVAKNRHPENMRTECPQGHPYSSENTILEKNHKRKCRECCRARNMANRAAKGYKPRKVIKTNSSKAGV